MERRNLIQARRNAGLTQVQVAKAMQVRQATVSAWETGKEEPYSYQVPLIHDILKSDDPHLFDIFGTDIQGSYEGIKVMDAIRRHLTKIIAILGSSSVVGVPLSLSSFVEPETYLSQSSVSLNAGWKLLKTGDYSGVQDIVTEFLPTLTKLATDIASYQENAASLVVQAKILQANLANHNLNFSLRESLCLDAVRYAELSGNTRLYLTAIKWYGDTYTYCYHQPQRAITIFGQAIPYLDNDAPLNKSDICMAMAIAYAQDKNEANLRENEKKARDYATQAQIAMPEYPEMDPFYQCIQTGKSELEQFEGKMYLYLAEHFPTSDYGLRAYDAFSLSLSKQAGTVGYRTQALIRKGDSARVIGEMDEMVTCLENGLNLVNSRKKLSEISDVLNGIPDEWRKETPVIALQKELAHAITVTH